ncbi:uncharacterized protein LOC123346087 isoform X1 [Mauremys mutica]|uniref:uncharacterized protein LOC123346087 isoform X1 n=1 Tax=Mauremys mutica TaxID=74926 RepID=UPI001D166873|nr:uncharacterized protein LOC123346087 isoform X1 [Mauremys mutica]
MGGSAYSCLLDSGAAISTVIAKPKEENLTDKSIPVMGIGGKPFECSVLQEAAVEISGVSASHAFLLAPDSPANLLGRDLLCKLRAQIFFSADKIILRLPQNQLPQLCAALTQATEDPILPASPMNLPERLRREVHASLWGTSKTNLGTLRTEPVQIILKPDIDIPRIRQYPILQQALLGLRKLINTFLRLGVLIRTSSPFNTPILPVRKPDLDPEGKPVYRFVQDLRAVNKVVQARHNVIPNPHTILTAIPAGTACYSVTDLCNAFFSIPLDQDCWDIFAFTWTDSETGRAE